MAGTTLSSTSQTEIQSLINVKDHSDIPALSNLLLSSTSSSSPGIDLISANGIWTTNSIKPNYIEIAENIHGVKAGVLPKTFDPINEYVSQKTKGMITELFDAGGKVDPLTVAILVNAVYFKGMWKEQFQTSLTEKGIFHAIQNDGSIQQREAMLMKTSRNMPVGMDIKSLGGAHGVFLEYGGDADDEKESEFGALFLLPPENTIQSMQDMISNLVSYMKKNDKKSKSKKEQTFSPPRLQTLLQTELHRSKVSMTLPRFKISYGAKSLKSELKSLGMKSAFDENGTFDEMSDDPLVHLDDIYHKTTMEVTEEGTVAAAATGGVMMTRSIVIPEEVNFDRPFMMIVFHLKTGLPLFVGKIDDPELMF